MRIKMTFIIAFFPLICVNSLAFAQATGNSFPTPNGQVTGGAAILVPAGPIVNGQPVMAPPSQVNGLPTVCTNCSPSAPTGRSSNTISGTVAVTNTFQTVITQNSARSGCTIQNQGSHTMYFTTAGSPSLTNSFQIAPGAAYTCTSPGSNVTSTDQIQMTGTSGDAFAGTWQ